MIRSMSAVGLLIGLFSPHSAPGVTVPFDLFNWQTHFGTEESPLANVSRVPEPSAWIMLMLALPVMLRYLVPARVVSERVPLIP